MMVIMALSLFSCGNPERKVNSIQKKINEIVESEYKNIEKHSKLMSRAHDLIREIPKEYEETAMTCTNKVELYNIKCILEHYNSVHFNHSKYIEDSLEYILTYAGYEYLLSRAEDSYDPEFKTYIEISNETIDDYTSDLNWTNSHNNCYNSLLSRTIQYYLTKDDIVTATKVLDVFAPRYEIVSKKATGESSFWSGKKKYNVKFRGHQSESLVKARKKIETYRLVEIIEQEFNETKFARGSCQIKQTYALDKLVNLLKKDQSISVKFIGHTSADGVKEANQKLSFDRAKAAAKYVENKGISVSRIFYEGKGSDELKNTLDPTSEENCRIEIIIQ